MSPWLKHVKATLAGNPKLKKKEGLKGILKLASKTYKRSSASGKGAHKKKKGHKKSQKQSGGRSCTSGCNSTQSHSEPSPASGASSLLMSETNSNSNQPYKGGKKRKSRRGRKSGKKSKKTRARRKSRK